MGIVFLVLLSLSVMAEESFFSITGREMVQGSEARNDVPLSLANASSYYGAADLNAPTGSALWVIIRIDHDANGKQERYRIRSGLKWSERDQGW